MRFLAFRWWGRGFLGVAMLAALSAAAAGEDAVPPGQPDDDSAEMKAFENQLWDVTPTADDVSDDASATQPQPTPAVRPDSQPQPTPVARPDSDPRPTPAVRPQPESPTEKNPKREAVETASDVKQAAGAAAQSQASTDALKPIPDALDIQPVKIAPAGFNGVTPGKTTAAEVTKAWGAPKEIRKQGANIAHLYTVGPFKHVEVTFHKDTAISVVVRLEHSFPAKTVAEQLDLVSIQPVMVADERGAILGQAYPERGVMFAFEPSKEPGKASMKVAQIVLESITTEPFVLRAETYLESRPKASLLDIKNAMKLQPSNARAHWLYSRMMVARDDYETALKASRQAVRLAPENPHYRVTRAQILGQVGQLAEAVREAKKTIQISGRQPHVKARALCLLGDLIASGPKPDYGKAIRYHTQAVKTAHALSADPHPAVRITAKEVLVDAHLGAAHDIAWGTWQEKNRAVARWLQQAGEFAKDLVENEDADAELRFRVAIRALAACVGVRGGLDPTDWTEDVVQSGQQLINAANDPGCKAQLQWDLGMALYDALQVYQMRSDHATALKYGEQAIEYLEAGNEQAQAAGANYLLGRLYFRMGAIHALRDENHGAAVGWFDKAVPLLKQPVPENTLADLGQHGETFVSMGVSYWETGQREKAVELTELGAKLMERAVKRGSLDETSLAVPYSNLASMHRQLGAERAATEFEQMATKLKHTKLK